MSSGKGDAMADHPSETTLHDVERHAAPSEQALIAVARTDARPFAALYDRYVDRVYAYLYRQTGRREIAEDLTSLTFLRALAAIGRFDSRRPFAPWLFRIAHNALMDHRRSAARTARLTDDIVQRLVEDADPRRESAVEQAEAFLAYTKGLPAEQRDVLALRFIADLSTEQTAALLGRSIGATKTLVWRAVATVRAHRHASGREEDR